MIAIVAPEPAGWVKPAVEAAAALGPVWLFAPFLVPAPPPMLPSRLREAWQRRHLALPTHVQKVAVPGWTAVEAGLRRFAAGRADRLIRGRMLLRGMVDALAARALPVDIQAVVAPSFAARRTFSVAQGRQALRLLLQDFPLLRQLHLDLDLAAQAWPTSRFVVRHRASAREVAAQEMEQVLADWLLVRGRYARTLLAGPGREEKRVASLEALQAVLGGVGRPLPGEDPPALVGGPRWRSPLRQVLLAGLATARNGSFEALAALERLPALTLLIRAGEGLEPEGLLRHPRVRAATKAERQTLEGVDAVLAPAWCESYPEEIPLAAARGVPVIATARAAGWFSLEQVGQQVRPGAVDDLWRALQSLPTQSLDTTAPGQATASGG